MNIIQGEEARQPSTMPLTDTLKGLSQEKANAWITLYLNHIIQERRLAQHTGLNYGRDLHALIELMGEQELSELQSHQIRRFVAQLHARGLDGRSLARMLSAWRGFYRFMSKYHRWDNNPCVGVRAPKAAKRLPAALSPEDSAQLMGMPTSNVGCSSNSHLQAGKQEAGRFLLHRDKAMFELFYSSGLRLAELTSLNLGDIHVSDATLRVTGKGNKTRIVPVGRHALSALNQWLTGRALWAPEEEAALFITRQGARLGARAVQLRLKHWAREAGLTVNVHPHMLRHSFASHVLQSSGDLRAVQEMLGHASISTTQVYTQLDFQHLSKVYDGAHPRAKRKKSVEWK